MDGGLEEGVRELRRKDPGERTDIIFWNVRGCSDTILDVRGTVGKQAQVQPHPWGEATSGGARCSRTLRGISGTAASLKDKRRISHAHPDLLQAQQLVICLLFIASTAHIRAVLIAQQPISIKHRSRSSFASPFMSTTNHYGLFWSTHSQLILASRIIHAAATLGSLLPVHTSDWVSFSLLIFF